MKFYSQWEQDQFLYENYFKNTRSGIFLDIGAQSGIDLSNTYFFEKEMGWNGICVEADEEVFHALARNRACICENAVIYNQKQMVDFLMMPQNTYMQGIKDDLDDPDLLRQLGENKIKNEIVTKETVTIMEILDKHQMYNFDYCSLDTEGSELKVLEGMEFDRVNIGVFTIECKGDKTSKLLDFMEIHGYDLIKSHHDVEHFFVKSS